MPRYESSVEFWQYQAALDANLYPRPHVTHETEPLTPLTLTQRCWPAEEVRISTEDLERYARRVWPDLGRPQLERVLGEGLRAGQWGA